MRRHMWGGWPLALALLLASCAQPPAQAPVSAPTEPPAQPGGPKPIQPLVPAPAHGGGGGATPRPSQLSPDQAVIETSVAGDPSLIVYPTKTLTPGARYPVMVFFHGYGMDPQQLTARTDLAEAAAAEGWISAAGALGGRGHWGNEQALRRTGALIAELVEKHQADPSRIYLVGFSMGGGTALLAAANPLGLPYRAAAVVSTQGFTDLDAMTWSEAGGGTYAEPIAAAYGGSLEPAEAEAHSPLTHAPALSRLPVYLEHGESDGNVRPSHSRRLADALTALGASPEVHFYPGRSHGEETIGTSTIMSFLRGKAAP